MWKRVWLIGIAVPSLGSADVINGSFENGYDGWGLAKRSVSGTFATATVVPAGVDIGYGDSVFDYIDGEGIANYSSGLPMIAQPTDGTWEAVLLQNGPSTTQLEQTVALGADPELSFDLAYHNWDTGFSDDQTFRIQLRDPDEDAVLATVFETAGTMDMPMTHEVVDLGAFANTTVHMRFELAASNTFFDVQLDNIHVRSRAPVSHDTDVEPTAIDAGGCSTSGGGSPVFAVLALVALWRRRR
jgi:uncharacterized protein (TIGR03382 family)